MASGRAWKALLAATLLSVSPWLMASPNSCGLDWQTYKQRFMLEEGRIIDTGNANVSHSEGQGWGMLLAEALGDRQSFERLWQWTRGNLQRVDVELFSWRYEPDQYPPVRDPNNATDGDLLIAWALHLASLHWQNDEYRQASERIRQAVLNRLVRSHGRYQILLPGLEGFNQQADEVTVNLSYLVMPALGDFARLEPDAAWSKLIDDGVRLLQNARFGVYQLPPDWMTVSDTGMLNPDKRWPARFSFDAVRIPLYFKWQGLQRQNPDLLRPFSRFWQVPQPSGLVPAWIDLKSGETAPYPISTGVRAISAWIDYAPLPSSPVATEDYYSSSLYMLTRLARGDCY